MELLPFLEQRERISLLVSSQEACDWALSETKNSKSWREDEIGVDALSKNPHAKDVVEMMKNRRVEKVDVMIDLMGRLQGEIFFCGNSFSWKDGLLNGAFTTKEDVGREDGALLVEHGLYENGRKAFRMVVGLRFEPPKYYG
nr:hypothetical protein MarFTME_345 [Marseillevirus futianmevirus]